MEYTLNELKKVRNRLFEQSLSIGKNNPISLHSKENYVYRVTGMDQIQDIINFGYVRPKINSKYEDQVYWTKGGRVNYYDKRPVIETSLDILRENNQLGAISLDELTGIYIFDEIQNRYVNQIDMIKQMRFENQSKRKGL